MSGAAPPLRFLGVVLGGWVCARAAVLAPDWMTEEVQASEAPPPPSRTATPVVAAAAAVPAIFSLSSPPSAPPLDVDQAVAEREPAPAFALSLVSGQLALVPRTSAATVEETASHPTALVAAATLQPSPVQSVAAVLETGPKRLAVSGWAIVREGGGSQLAAGGVLGGSQVGARATYRLNESLALSGRVSSPLEGDGVEAAVGIEWQPSPDVPIKLLAERRQAIGDGGRSDFALLAHGGVSDIKVAGRLTVEGYAQAGMVGAEERDPFADGAVKLNLPVGGGVSVGAGAWGAAQPGVERLDVGPQVSMTLPGGGATIKVAAEWRVRVAGDALPGSGPALTLSTDF